MSEEPNPTERDGEQRESDTQPEDMQSRETPKSDPTEANDLTYSDDSY